MGVVQRRSFKVVAMSAAAFIVPAAAVAQGSWLTQDSRANIGVEVLRPGFESELDMGFATSTVFLSGRAPLGDRWSVAAELPFAQAYPPSASGIDASVRLGNPYVGLGWQRPASRFQAEVGIRAPLMGEPETPADLGPILTGLVSDLERMEAFLPDSWAASALANYTTSVGPLDARLRGGPTVLWGDGASDVLMSYTAQLWYDAARLAVGAGYSGRANVSSDDGFDEDTASQILMAAHYAFGRLRPGVQLRLPLDQEMRDVASTTLGVSLSYRLR